jgi:hypothetical protein
VGNGKVRKMRFMKWANDGGPESTVDGFFFIEFKGLFSIALLRFGEGSREAFHSHAFNCFSWVLRGNMTEFHKDGRKNALPPRNRLLPFGTYRDTFHKVVSDGVSWVFTLRGPWSETWKEYIPESDKDVVLTDGRVEVHGA